MTPPLRIQLLSGAQAGLQTTHTDPKLSFGRDPGASIVIDEAHLSRHHGDLVAIEGQWAVVNHSANGTTVNGKKIKADQPRVLHPGDVVGVGKVKLFAVQYAPGSSQPVAEFDTPSPDAAADAGNRMSRRGKLWMALGIYGFLMLVVFIVLLTVGKDDGSGKRSIPPQLKDSEISREIAAPYTMPRDEAKANQALDEAHDFLRRPGAAKRAKFDALHNYKLALAYSKKSTFDDGGDVLAYAQLKKQLTEEVIDTYRQAYTMVYGSQWISAEKKLREVHELYPAHDSIIFKNVNDHLSYVLSQKSGR